MARPEHATVSVVIELNGWEMITHPSPAEQKVLTFASKALASVDDDGKIELHPDVTLLAGELASRQGPWGWQLTWDGEDRSKDEAGVRRNTRLLVEDVDSTEPGVLAYVGGGPATFGQTAWLVTVSGEGRNPDEFMFFAFGREAVPGQMMLMAKQRAGDAAGGSVPILQARPLTAADVARLMREG